MVSGTTLSGQPENIRGVGVVVHSKKRSSVRSACGKVLKRSAATETGVHVVPPFELIAFAQLPTKQHHSAISERREIDEASFEVLQLNTQSFKFGHLCSEIREEIRRIVIPPSIPPPPCSAPSAACCAWERYAANRLRECKIFRKISRTDGRSALASSIVNSFILITWNPCGKYGEFAHATK